jgi:hypothetical protein
MNLALRRIAGAATVLVLAFSACSADRAGPASGTLSSAASVAIPLPEASTCTPAPLPTPEVTLVIPAAEAAKVARKIGRIRFEMIGGSTANELTLKPPRGRVVETRSITPVGTPGPSGQTIFDAKISGLLAAQTKYSVYVSVVQNVGGCGQKYLSPSSYFKTGTKRK